MEKIYLKLQKKMYIHLIIKCKLDLDQNQEKNTSLVGDKMYQKIGLILMRNSFLNGLILRF